MTMEAPRALAHIAVYEKVENILASHPRGRVLDVPAGQGALGVRLKSLGFDVSCCDLYPQIFSVPDIPVKQGNMDATLPYADAEFDVVVCVGGIDHAENPANAIREFARMLKPGGSLIVSAPNILNIEERVKWLFSGHTSFFKPLSNERRSEIRENFDGLEEVGVQLNPISYSEMRFYLEKTGFHLINIHLDKKKKNSWLYWPLTFLIRRAASFTSAEKRKARWTDELNSETVLNGGNSLIFEAKKI